MLQSSGTTLAIEIITSRYISAIGFVILLWDTLLILPDEIARVWTTGITAAKIAYLTNHYAAIAILTVLVHAFSGVAGVDPGRSFCVNATTVGLAGGVISLGVGNYLVLLQVWQLWEQRPSVRLLLTLGWGASYLATLVIACLVIQDVPATIIVVPGFHTCGLSEIPKLVRVIWACPIVFEVLVFIFTVWNAMDRPRPADESLAKALYVDGIVYFVTLSLLRVFNFVITATAPTPLVSAGSCIIWEINLVMLNRLILNQRVPLPGRDDSHLDEHFTFDLERVDVHKSHVRSQASLDALTLTELEYFPDKSSRGPTPVPHFRH